jgi:transposase
MMCLEDWFDETEVPFAKRMDDQKGSNLFAAIDRSDRDIFFREWIRLRTEREYIVYEVTSVSTYSHGIEMAEMSYNRDKEYLPQLNLGMYYGISSHLPVYYCLYNGSITDKMDLISMMSEAKDLGIENVRFVMDKGFVTDGNFKYMRDNGYSFITALPGGRLDAASLIDNVKPSIRKAANRIDEYEVYGVCVATKIYDLDIDAHIYYDPENKWWTRRNSTATSKGCGLTWRN